MLCLVNFFFISFKYFFLSISLKPITIISNISLFKFDKNIRNNKYDYEYPSEWRPTWAAPKKTAAKKAPAKKTAAKKK